MNYYVYKEYNPSQSTDKVLIVLLQAFHIIYTWGCLKCQVSVSQNVLMNYNMGISIADDTCMQYPVQSTIACQQIIC